MKLEKIPAIRLGTAEYIFHPSSSFLYLHSWELKWKRFIFEDSSLLESLLFLSKYFCFVRFESIYIERMKFNFELNIFFVLLLKAKRLDETRIRRLQCWSFIFELNVCKQKPRTTKNWILLQTRSHIAKEVCSKSIQFFSFSVVLLKAFQKFLILQRVCFCKIAFRCNNLLLALQITFKFIKISACKLPEQGSWTFSHKEAQAENLELI